MSNRYLISVTTPNYVCKTGRYFDSLPLVGSAHPAVVLLDFNEQTDPDGAIENRLRQEVDWPTFRKMALPASHSHYMIQHGRFLDALEFVRPDDLICLTDLDIQLQRDFLPEEWAEFDRLNDHQIAATWNGGEKDNLKLEADRIELTAAYREKVGGDEALAQIQCRNCGVLVGRVSAFRRLQGLYESLCEEFYANAPHRSRCQWLINWCLHTAGAFCPLPPAVHMHAHFRTKEGDIMLPAGTHLRRKYVCWNGVPVLFLHNFPPTTMLQ